MLGALRKDPRWVNWFYGFAPPERGTIRLGHRRVYIVPARIGWMFGATLAILLLGIAASNRARGRPFRAVPQTRRVPVGCLVFGSKVCRGSPSFMYAVMLVQ